jgi:uncharacterized membrane protein YozB (DUF420 family)
MLPKRIPRSVRTIVDTRAIMSALLTFVTFLVLYLVQSLVATLNFKNQVY